MEDVSQIVMKLTTLRRIEKFANAVTMTATVTLDSVALHQCKLVKFLELTVCLTVTKIPMLKMRMRVH